MQFFDLTTAQLISISALLIYFSFITYLNLSGGRNQSQESYAIGNRAVGYIATTGTIAAGIRDGSGLVLWVSFAYTAGYGGLWLIFGIFVSLSIMSWFGGRVRALSIERDYLTVNQMVYDEVGRLSQRASSLIVLIVVLLTMAMQIYVAGNFSAALLRIPDWLGMISVASIVTLYLYIGGYSAVVRTNTFQFFWILSLFIVPLLLPPHYEDVTRISSLFSMPVLDRIGLFMIGFLFPFSNGDTWQHIFSAKSAQTIRSAFPSGGVALLIMTISLICLGFGIKTYLPDADPKHALFTFFQAELVSPFILAYVAIVIMAITTSDLDSQTYVFVSTAIKNLAPRSWATDREQYRSYARIVLIAAMIFTTGIALTIKDVVQFLFQTVSLVYVLAPVFVFAGLGIFKRSPQVDRGVTLVIAISGVAFLALFFSGLLDQHLILTTGAALVSLIGCSIVARLTRE